MNGSAQRKEEPEVLDFGASSEAAPAVAGTESALKQAVAERLAAHRSRRAAEQELAAQVSQRQGSGSPSRRASARVRDAGTRKPFGSSDIGALLTGLMRPSTRSRLDDFAMRTFCEGNLQSI